MVVPIGRKVRRLPARWPAIKYLVCVVCCVVMSLCQFEKHQIVNADSERSGPVCAKNRASTSSALCRRPRGVGAATRRGPSGHDWEWSGRGRRRRREGGVKEGREGRGGWAGLEARCRRAWGRALHFASLQPAIKGPAAAIGKPASESGLQNGPPRRGPNILVHGSGWPFA